jgi:DNA-binding NarL/FixJ family response regulator
MYVAKNGKQLVVEIPLQTILLKAVKKAHTINLLILTRRERQVLKGLLAGKQRKEIAADLNITPRTIMFHAKQIYLKTGLSRTDLLREYGTVEGMPETTTKK